MANKYVFSTGYIRFGDPAATLDDDDRLYAIQNVTFTESFQTSEVREAAQVNKWVIADAQHGAEATLSFDSPDLNLDLMGYVTGAAVTTGGGWKELTASATDNPKYTQIFFEGVDTEGKKRQIILPRSKSFQLPVPFKQDGFVMPQYTFKSYPKSGASDGTQIPFKIREEQ